MLVTVFEMRYPNCLGIGKLSVGSVFPARLSDWIIKRKKVTLMARRHHLENWILTASFVPLQATDGDLHGGIKCIRTRMRDRGILARCSC